MPPDRERFYRQYGAEIRYTSYDTSGGERKAPPPSMYSATIGQDQMITGGFYRGTVLKFDAFYPLTFELANDKPVAIYLFGTANMAVQKPANRTPLALQLVQDCGSGATSTEQNPCGVPIWDPNVAVFARASARDTYRIGIGIDVISFIKAIVSPAQ